MVKEWSLNRCADSHTFILVSNFLNIGAPLFLYPFHLRKSEIGKGMRKMKNKSEENKKENENEKRKSEIENLRKSKIGKGMRKMKNESEKNKNENENLRKSEKE